MTFIFDVHTGRAKGRKLAFTVEALNEEHTRFPRNPEFGLQIIMDAWYRSSDSGAGPVSAETEAEFKELFEIYFGRKVAVDNRGYLLDEDLKERREPPVKARDLYGDELNPTSGGFYENGIRYFQRAPKAAEFAQRTSEVVTSFELSGEDWPYASFDLEVSDERYLEHMTKKTWFRTAFTGHLPERPW
ncbi:hypothetical protein AB0I53_34630 [Saccharopolyspora sp. NPDC050389]|uniref:hypothetical protein n=1 Tax=Saccharopolyspora sp. NPDC050389 TaxID=3155516 RepID=UPI0033F92E9F